MIGGPLLSPSKRKPLTLCATPSSVVNSSERDKTSSPPESDHYLGATMENNVSSMPQVVKIKREPDPIRAFPESANQVEDNVRKRKVSDNDHDLQRAKSFVVPQSPSQQKPLEAKSQPHYKQTTLDEIAVGLGASVAVRRPSDRHGHRRFREKPVQATVHSTNVTNDLVDVPDMLEWKSSVLDEAERNLKLGVRNELPSEISVASAKESIACCLLIIESLQGPLHDKLNSIHQFDVRNLSDEAKMTDDDDSITWGDEAHQLVRKRQRQLADDSGFSQYEEIDAAPLRQVARHTRLLKLIQKLGQPSTDSPESTSETIDCNSDDNLLTDMQESELLRLLADNLPDIPTRLKPFANGSAETLHQTSTEETADIKPKTLGQLDTIGKLMEGLRGCIEKIVNQSDDSVESAAPSVEVVVKSEVVDAAPAPKAPRKQSRKQAAEKSQLAETSIAVGGKTSSTETVAAPSSAIIAVPPISSSAGFGMGNSASCAPDKRNLRADDLDPETLTAIFRTMHELPTVIQVGRTGSEESPTSSATSGAVTPASFRVASGQGHYPTASGSCEDNHLNEILESFDDDVLDLILDHAAGPNAFSPAPLGGETDGAGGLLMPGSLGDNIFSFGDERDSAPQPTTFSLDSYARGPVGQWQSAQPIAQRADTVLQAFGNDAQWRPVYLSPATIDAEFAIRPPTLAIASPLFVGGGSGGVIGPVASLLSTHPVGTAGGGGGGGGSPARGMSTVDRSGSGANYNALQHCQFDDIFNGTAVSATTTSASHI